jgi:hypothetical protein
MEQFLKVATAKYTATKFDEKCCRDIPLTTTVVGLCSASSPSVSDFYEAEMVAIVQFHSPARSPRQLDQRPSVPLYIVES